MHDILKAISSISHKSEMVVFSPPKMHDAFKGTSSN